MAAHGSAARWYSHSSQAVFCAVGLSEFQAASCTPLECPALSRGLAGAPRMGGRAQTVFFLF